MAGKLGRFLCSIGLHRWSGEFVTTRTYLGMSLWGCRAHKCTREGCEHMKYYPPS